MRNKLNAKQKATREPNEKRTKWEWRKKKKKQQLALYEKYETEINRKQMKCEANE